MSLVRLSNTWRTTTFRLTLIYGLLFFLGTGILVGFIYLQTQRYFSLQMDQNLRLELDAYRAIPQNRLAALIDEDIARDLRHVKFNGLFSVSGQRLAGDLESLPPLPADYTSLRVVNVSLRDGRTNRVVDDVQVLVSELPDGTRLVVGRYNTLMKELEHIILLALSGAAVVVIIITLVGARISIKPLQRIEEVKQASDQIMAGDIERRLPLAGKHDEIDMLALIINHMLDELQRLMLDIKSSTDRVAHDLKTPLTRLRAKLHRAQIQLAENQVEQQLVSESIIEADALLARFRTLMRVSEISSLTRRASFEMIDLKRLLHQVFDLYEPLAQEKQIALTIDESYLQSALVHADEGLLFEALANLVDNAIKFTPEGGRVRLCITPEPEGLRIDVIDSGPGVPANEIALMTQPFHRGQKAATTVEGYGLGLSIVNAILRLHGFRLVFVTESTGMRASIECWQVV